MRVAINRDIVRKAFDQVKDERMFAESRKAFERGGMPLEMSQAMLIRPDIAKAFAQFSAGIYPGGNIETILKEKVIIRASQLNDCQFCRDAHCDFIAAYGVKRGEEVAPSNERERLAIEYTEIVTKDSNGVTDQLFNRIKQHFTDEEIVELTMCIGMINMLNRFNNALGVHYNGENAPSNAAGTTP